MSQYLLHATILHGGLALFTSCQLCWRLQHNYSERNYRTKGPKLSYRDRNDRALICAYRFCTHLKTYTAKKLLFFCNIIMIVGLLVHIVLFTNLKILAPQTYCCSFARLSFNFNNYDCFLPIHRPNYRAIIVISYVWQHSSNSGNTDCSLAASR